LRYLSILAIFLSGVSLACEDIDSAVSKISAEILDKFGDQILIYVNTPINGEKFNLSDISLVEDGRFSVEIAHTEQSEQPGVAKSMILIDHSKIKGLTLKVTYSKVGNSDLTVGCGDIVTVSLEQLVNEAKSK